VVLRRIGVWLVSHSLILSTMNERKTKRRRGGFQPPFCPNHDCQFHAPDPSWAFIRFGFYSPAHSHRSYQVFRCKHCSRRFTALTFSTSYWLHRKPLLRKIAALIAEGPGLHQIARFLGTSHSLVGRYVSRLGRHCFLYLVSVAEVSENTKYSVIMRVTGIFACNTKRPSHNQ
jgi:transposase-like protein